ncbi:Fe-S protein assembly chaperone HscA [Pusillimonas noertemannii]|uniref:Chaperone protein HscA homolog n=1 Tax=Pusillimonas noertemannii TaxID=305977 RepID=A0A2U1CHH1_9BURK|nr:Fe-S protein assembly chaperone HscA [Pusillimonas noertemannii]NYT70183.1 Fe-S protein assembly chaperone HscA [Pusillimonas noertemannii]PVY60362.1 chaperone protein HscA [Pusillimonas noertemannii]TFL08167.1 Fe-S protein assembly chaperone HscA [Pusillimonas noertemannii]
MALLQISEPGESPVPHQRKLAVGIDLGTTHSLVAAVRSSVPEVLSDAEGRVLLPSVVRYLADGGRQVGYEARARQASDTLNTIASVKRLIGRSLEEARREGAAYEFSEQAEGVRLQTVQGGFSPVEVSSHILSVLRERAEGVLGGDLVGAVITVPAYFDDAQRQATRDAGRLAGLTVLRLLNEPTAAAIAYGLDHAAEGIYAVYDLGGGTFDISILRLTKGVFEVVATGGDTQLGGDDFDALIVSRLVPAERLQALGKGDLRALHVAARAAREALSDAEQVPFQVDLSDGSRVQGLLERADFESWAQPLVQRTLNAATRALRDAGLEREQIKGVVMVGGATRMPLVRSEVARLFGAEPLTDLDPDRVVALGAALQANLLAGNRGPDDDWLLLDVTPLSLGLETMGGLVERVIPRNSTIPVARAQEFTTFKDGQTAMSIHAVQGERELVADCRSLARFELRGIPPMVAGAARIRVTFQVDADGLLHVSAREDSTGVEASVSVKPSYGLSDDEVAQMLAAGMDNAGSDAHARALREQQVELRQLVESVNAALAGDADLLTAEESQAIAGLLKRAGRVLAMDDVDTLRKTREDLAAATDSFAARRMDRSIRAALSGKTLDEVSRK